MQPLIGLPVVKPIYLDSDIIDIILNLIPFLVVVKYLESVMVADQHSIKPYKVMKLDILYIIITKLYFTAISSDSRPPKFEMLDINNCF